MDNSSTAAGSAHNGPLPGRGLSRYTSPHGYSTGPILGTGRWRRGYHEGTTTVTAVLPAPTPATEPLTTDHDDLTDAQLLQRHCDGCRRAYRVLITRHERLLSWTLHHLGIAPEQHADILQDALLKVHRQAASFRGTGGAGPWLRTILTNTALSHLRDTGRRRENVDTGDDGLLDRLRHTPDPRVVDATRTLQRLILREAVDTLHPGLREAVILSDIHGLSMADVSTRTGVPVGTVKSRLSRARRQLRDRLTAAGVAPSVRVPRTADTRTAHRGAA